MIDDPYEINNLYNSTLPLHKEIKEKLYGLLPAYVNNSRTKVSVKFSGQAKEVWKENDNYMVPWDFDGENDGFNIDDDLISKDIPVKC